jgi:hypothetical protein
MTFEVDRDSLRIVEAALMHSVDQAPVSGVCHLAFAAAGHVFASR